MARLDRVDQLRRLLGTPNEAVPLKIHSELTEAGVAFIGKSPMAFLSTCGADGMPTVSPKGDPAGFVHVADPRTLLVPERKGNKLLFSLQNILANPKVGLIFLVPGTCETLRVQGTAELLDDRELCERLSSRGNSALLVIRVTIEACYFHCAKAFIRSDLWKPETWPDRIRVSFGQEIAARGGLKREDIAAFDSAVEGRYKTDL
jgi:PPOX class probable FMN-dependent enzyme